MTLEENKIKEEIIDDGGPAFPSNMQVPEGHWATGSSGMSVRTWLSGQALIGLIQKIKLEEDTGCEDNPYHEDFITGKDSEVTEGIAKNNREYLAETALKIADTMIELLK